MKEGDAVTAGQTIASLKPDKASLGAALRALAYVGTSDDLPIIDQYTPSSDADIRAGADAAAKSIRSRAMR